MNGICSNRHADLPPDYKTQPKEGGKVTTLSNIEYLFALLGHGGAVT